MIRRLKKEAYPILEGKALVKVNLRNNDSAVSMYDRIRQQFKHFMVNRQIRSFFPVKDFTQAPVVRLYNSRDFNCASTFENLEYNMVSDVVSPVQKFHLALGSIAAAGIIALSAFGIMGKAGIGKDSRGEVISGVNFSEKEVAVSSEARTQTHFVVTGSHNEQVLLASLSNPMSNYPFRRLAGHSNIPGGAHHNIAGGAGHTNIPGAPTHTDNGSGHTNNPHGNYHGHNNGVTHTNAYTDSP